MHIRVPHIRGAGWPDAGTPHTVPPRHLSHRWQHAHTGPGSTPPDNTWQTLHVRLARKESRHSAAQARAHARQLAIKCCTQSRTYAKKRLICIGCTMRVAVMCKLG